MIYTFDHSLAGQHIKGDLNFVNAYFHGVLCLDNTTVEGNVNLDGITSFAHISIKNTVFKGKFSMQNALLLGGLWVENTHFAALPLFKNTQIHGRLHGVQDNNFTHFGVAF